MNFKKWLPVAGIALLTISLMLIFKYRKNDVHNLLKEGATEAINFYTDNLKPLFVKTDLNKEDIFNFALFKNLPLDKNNIKFLQLGNESDSESFYEIKNVSSLEQTENYNKFTNALNLNETEKYKLDSILYSYKDKIYSSILVNENNTFAIDPELNRINAALIIDILAFAKNIDKDTDQLFEDLDLDIADLSKLKIDLLSDLDISETERDFIFFSSDTVFASNIMVNEQELKKQIAHYHNNKTTEDLDKNLSVALGLSEKAMEDEINKKMKVFVDSNFSRIQLPIKIKFDKEIEKLRKLGEKFSDFSLDGLKKSYKKGDDGAQSFNFNYRSENDSVYNFIIENFIPNIDSIIRVSISISDSSHTISLNNLISEEDSVAEKVYKSIKDSAFYFDKRKFKQDHEQLKKEMQKLKEELSKIKPKMK